MCGIIGQTIKGEELVRKGTALLKHRGPDAEGVYIDQNFSFGHRRLSVLDLSSLANQPMLSDNGNLAIVFNGEIYNFHELREMLVSEVGYPFKTDGDTEVILAGYKHFGISFFSKMRGMWALAIYDRNQEMMILTRDVFGIKPLYYAEIGLELAFASEIRALKVLMPKLDIDSDAYYQFF